MLQCLLHLPQFQMRRDSCLNLLNLKRFGDVIDAAGIECLNFIAGIGQRTDENDRDIF